MPDEPRSPNPTEVLATSISEHSQYLGRLAMAWSNVHVIIAHLFIQIVHPKDTDLGSAIWNAVTNDRMQRRMFQAAVKGSRTLPKGYGVRLQWALGEIDGLENQRDAALHAPYEHDEANARFVAAHSTGHLRAIQLRHADLGELFHGAAMDMLELGSYLAFLSLRLRAADDKASWPKKPSLQRLRPPKSLEEPPQKKGKK